MRFITTVAHAILDYLLSISLIASPGILDYYDAGPETWVPVTIGGIILAYSIFTDYPLGLIKKIPISIHLNIDLFSGIFLAVSPWLLGFSHLVYLPHLIIGILLILLWLTTQLKVIEETDSVANY